jgi:DNA-binding MarR family transcriptional regulator
MQSGRLARLLESDTDARYLAAGLAGVTSARASVLHVLFSGGEGMTAQQVAREIGVSKVTASRLIRALEEEGWLVRHAHETDGRAYELRLTAKALKMFPKLLEVHNESLDSLFMDATAEQLEGYLKSLERSLARLVRKR